MTPEIEVTEVSLGDIDLLDVGNAIGLAGAIYTGQGKTMLVPFPGMTIDWDISVLRMTGAEWERFLHQSDVLDVRGPAKAILRKLLLQYLGCGLIDSYPPKFGDSYGWRTTPHGKGQVHSLTPFDPVGPAMLRTLLGPLNPEGLGWNAGKGR